MKITVMNNWFFNLFCLIVAFQLIVFSLFLFTSRKKISSAILAVFFIAESFSFLNVIPTYNLTTLTLDTYPFLLHIGTAFSLLWGPTYYLYVFSMIHPAYKITKKTFIHGIPFILAWLFTLLFIQFNITGHRVDLTLHNRFIVDRLIPLVLITQLVVYNILTVRLLRPMQDNMIKFSLKENSYLWAKFFIFGYLIGCILNISIWFISSYSGWACIQIFNLSGYFYYFVFFNVIFFNALLNPEIFHDDATEQKKYYYTGLTTEQEEAYYRKLILYMKEYKPFLQPNLTLSELSSSLNIHMRQLSQVINQREKCTVPDFFNRYRIEYVLEKLRDPHEKHLTFLELLYESGFNSKTAFNITFKKYTGYTPTQYRKIHKNL